MFWTCILILIIISCLYDKPTFYCLELRSAAVQGCQFPLSRVYVSYPCVHARRLGRMHRSKNRNSTVERAGTANPSNQSGMLGATSQLCAGLYPGRPRVFPYFRWTLLTLFIVHLSVEMRQNLLWCLTNVLPLSWLTWVAALLLQSLLRQEERLWGIKRALWSMFIYSLLFSC